MRTLRTDSSSNTVSLDCSSLDNSNALRILRLIFPDIIIFAASTICFVIIRRRLSFFYRRRIDERSLSTPVTPLSPDSTETNAEKKFWQRLTSILRHARLLLQFLLVGLAAFIYPSIINAMYFLFFLSLVVIWSLAMRLGHKFALARSLLVVYAGIHLLVLYLYQFTFFQDVFEPLSLGSK